MIGGRSALLGASGINPYGNWAGNYSDVSLLLRGGTAGQIGLLDESPNPITITTTGSTGISTTVFQYGGNSLFFPNNSSTATTADLSAFAFGSGDFTIEFWMRVSSPTWIFDLGLFFGVGNYGSGANIAFALNGSNFGVLNQPASGFSRSVGRGTDGIFHHVALCRASSVTRFFYDGILIGTTDLTTQSFGNSALYLNRVSLYSNSGINNGLHIDDLRITKGVARYTANFTPPAAELPANVTDDPSYNSVSLLLRNGKPGLVPFDESSTPKTITASGAEGISTTTFKYGDSSLTFNGSGGLSATYGTDLDLAAGDFTIEAWVRINALPGNGVGVTLVSRYTATARSYHWWLYQSGSTVFFFFDWTTDNSTRKFAYATIPTPNLNAFSHYAVVRSGNEILFFVDGQKRTLSGQDSPIGTFFNQPTPLESGTVNSIFGTLALNGYIDDLRITKNFARYTKNFLPPPAQLPAI